VPVFEEKIEVHGDEKDGATKSDLKPVSGLETEWVLRRGDGKLNKCEGKRQEGYGRSYLDATSMDVRRDRVLAEREIVRTERRMRISI